MSGAAAPGPPTESLPVVQVVAVIGQGGEFGGPATVATGVTVELVARGRPASLVALRLGRVRRPKGLTAGSWHLVPARRFVPGWGLLGLFNLRLLTRFWRAFAPGSIAHVHAGRDLVSLGALAVAALRGTPVVAQTHGMVRPRDSRVVRVFDVVFLRLLARSSVILYLTDDERADLTTLLGEAVALHRMSNGLEVAATGPDVPAAPATGRTDPVEAARVVFASRLHPVKRVLVFADAARLLLAEGVSADFVAYGPDQGDLGALLEMTRDPALDGHLRYGGALDHATTIDTIAAADVFVLPSSIDWMPMALLEAMAAGVPTVSTTTCGLAPAIQAAEAGLVVAGDTASVADAVRRLLADPQMRREVGRRGRELVEQSFSVGAVVDALESVYADVRRAASTSATIRSNPL